MNVPEFIEKYFPQHPMVAILQIMPKSWDIVNDDAIQSLVDEIQKRLDAVVSPMKKGKDDMDFYRLMAEVVNHEFHEDIIKIGIDTWIDCKGDSEAFFNIHANEIIG